MEELHSKKNGEGKDWVWVHLHHLQAWRNRYDKRLVDQRPYDHSQHERYMRWFSSASIFYLQNPRGVPNTYSAAAKLREIARGIVEKYRSVADQENRSFAHNLLHQLKAAVGLLLEPVNADNVFVALDNELIQQPIVSPEHNADAGPSNRRAAKRARRASTSSED